MVVVHQILETKEPEFASIDHTKLIPNKMPWTSRSARSNAGARSLVVRLMNPEPKRWGGAMSILTLEYDGGIECKLVGELAFHGVPVPYDHK